MSDELPEDFVDMVACLREEDCDFLIVGAHALAAHGAPRATGDLDIFVRPDPVNAERVYRALLRFGAPVAAHEVSPEDFRRPGTVYQPGLPPNRIDILTELSGIDFDEASRDTVAGHLGPEPVRCIGLDAMIRNSAPPVVPRTSPTSRPSRRSGPAADRAPKTATAHLEAGRAEASPAGFLGVALWHARVRGLRPRLRARAPGGSRRRGARTERR